MQLLKEELWLRRMTAKITMIGRKITAEECDVLKEIQKITQEKKKWSKHWRNKTG